MVTIPGFFFFFNTSSFLGIFLLSLFQLHYHLVPQTSTHSKLCVCSTWRQLAAWAQPTFDIAASKLGGTEEALELTSLLMAGRTRKDAAACLL